MSPERDSHAELERLAAIVQSSDDGIISKDLNGIVKTWNVAAERIFGYTADEMIGRSILTIIPDDRRGEEDEVLARIRRGELIEHFETIRRRKDGILIPVSLSVSPIHDADGTIVGASKIARDLSYRRRIEVQANFLARASALLATSLDYHTTLKTVTDLAVPQIADWAAVDLVDENGRIERLSVAHVDPSKVKSVTELLRRWPTRRDDPEGVAKVIRTGAPVLYEEAPDGLLVGVARAEAHLDELRTLGVRSLMIVPLTTPEGVAGAITFVTAESRRAYTQDDLRFAIDLASRAALAIQNARAFEQLRVANRLKDEFVATLSHELRTPLNAILGYARMLRSGIITIEKQARALEILDRNATSLQQIVDDVLDISRIVSGKMRLNVQSVDLPHVVRDAVATVTPAADAKGLQLQIIIDPLSGPVSGDPERLQQVIWNLLSNAVKFTGKGGRVQIKLAQSNSHVEIVVSDTGIGVRSEFLPHIFERFRQADSGLAREHGGLGLGLAIARHIVEMHGGTIHALSDGEGQGSTFRVELPVMIVHQEPVANRTRVHPRGGRGEAVETMPSLQGICVLVVDDDEDARAMVQSVLEAAGAVVVTAGSAPEALEALERTRPDVMISDLGLPKVDGFELLRRLRDSADPELRRIPAAALTAYARSQDRTKALRSGFEMHLTKPIDPVELAAAVASLARRRESTDTVPG